MMNNGAMINVVSVRLKKALVWLSLSAFLATLLLNANVSATPMQVWEAWVLEDYPDYQCPWRLSNTVTKECVWPGELVLSMNELGGDFSFTVEVFKKEVFVPLPGDAQSWPVDVVVNQKPAKMLDRAGKPYILLSQGTHRVEGHFHWYADSGQPSEHPAQMAMPELFAMIRLTIEGKQQVVDRRKNQLIFAKNDTVVEPSEAKKNNDNLTIEVFRLVTDGVPVKLNTHLRLTVSGKAREVTFGRVMLADTEVLNIRSPLPARIEDDGTMTAQVMPGEHIIEIQSRFLGSPIAINLAKKTANWPATEYISFQSAPRVRQVKLSGVTSIDPHQISIPANWRQLPTYALTAKETLRIATEVRGDQAPAMNMLILNKALWLDFDGQGMTVLDQISGTLHQGWRLDVAKNVQLGRASVDGVPALITQDQGVEGVEVRSANLQLESVSRLEQTTGFLASGWQTAFEHYSAQLHLPPGWRVLHASGVDQVKGTWLSRWDLWDIFLLLVIASVTRKLMGIQVALLSVLTVLMTLHEVGSPVLIIPVLLIIVALLSITSGKIHRSIRQLGFLVCVTLVVLVIGFAIDHFRLAIYPTLEKNQMGSYQTSFLEDDFVSEKSAKSAPMRMQTAVTAMEKLSPFNKEILLDYDQPPISESDSIQTGPGLPTWTWNTIHFHSSGPLRQNQRLHLVYSPPLVTGAWLVLSVLLVFLYASLVIVQFVKRCDFSMLGNIKASNVLKAATSTTMMLPFILITMGGAGLVIATAFSLTYAPQSYADTMPPQYLMDQLEARILKSPECLPDCVSLNNGVVHIDERQLQMEFEVYANAHVALPLPSGHGTWALQSVTESGLTSPLVKPVPLVKQEGVVFVAVQPGHHRLHLHGKLLEDQASIHFPLLVHNMRVSTTDWIVEGVVDGNVLQNTLTLQVREPSKTEKLDSLIPDPPATFAKVHRHFYFDKRWTVKTTVSRESDENATALSIRLLPNERLLQEVGIVDEEMLTIQFKHRQRRIQWLSTLPFSSTLSLKAAETDEYNEVWTLIPSSFWRLEYSGLSPLKPKSNRHAFEPTFKPWPGEMLNVNIRKPEGVEGSVFTVEKAILDFKAGDQLQRATLTLTISASIGTEVPIHLPSNADILNFKIDGRAMNIPSEPNWLLPVRPGEQVVTIDFQILDPLTLVSRTPDIQLGSHAVNVQIDYQLPRDRWPLYLTGPLMGPAMMVWGVLLMIVLGALALPQIARVMQLKMPISIFGWLFLGFGLSTVNHYGILLLATMFFGLAARKKWVSPNTLSRLKFNTLQVLIVLLVGCTMISLLFAIPVGLLSSPDMAIIGNNSSSHYFRYYQDIADLTAPTVASQQGSAFDPNLQTQLPIVSVFSVPINVYRLVMLLWALWLSNQLVKWSLWAWECFKEKGSWLPKKASDFKD